MELNCDICYESKPIIDFTYLECFHYLCDKCFIELRNDICPYCRYPITFLSEKIETQTQISLEEDDNETIYSEPEISPSKKKRKKNKTILSPKSLDKFKQKKRTQRNQYKSSRAHMRRI